MSEYCDNFNSFNDTYVIEFEITIFLFSQNFPFFFNINSWIIISSYKTNSMGESLVLNLFLIFPVI